MKNSFPLVALFSIGLSYSPAVFATSETYNINVPPGKSQIQFFSKATVEDFEGTAEQITGSLTADFSKADLNLSGHFSVLVNSMRTGLSMRDKHMLSSDWLNASAYPAIRFDLLPPEAQRVKKVGNQQWFVKAKGTWTMKGHSKEIEIPVTLTKSSGSNNQIIMKSRFPLHLTDFGIRGPIGMKILGAKVSPDVEVALVLNAEQQSGWSKPIKKKVRR